MTFGGGTGRIKMWWEVGSLLEYGEIFLGGEGNDQNFRLVGEGDGGGGVEFFHPTSREKTKSISI